MKKNSTDLTQGNILKLLIGFALPIFAGQVFRNLYNSVDSIVVGRTVGKTALAAVSSSADISMLLTGFFVGFSTGAGVVIARYFGARDPEKLHDAVHTALTFAIIIGVSMAALGIILAPSLLKLVKCPDDVYGEALAYLRIYLVGILFTSLYNLGSGVLRAVGDSRRPFYFLIISSCTNIVLDLLFVVGLKWSVRGAAVATIISQCLSCTLVYRKLITTEEMYKLVPSHLFHIKADILKEVVLIGMPAAIQSSLVSISNLFVQRYINGFGSAAMAGIGAAKKVDRFVGMIAQCLGLSTSTFVSQNVGAKQYSRASKGIKICLLICAVYVLTVGTTVYLSARPLIGLFTKDEEAIGFGIAMVHVMMPFYYFQSANQIFSNAVRGYGKSIVVMICSIVGMIVCRQIFLAVALGIVHDVRLVYVGFPVGWLFAALFVFIYYMAVIRRKVKGLKDGDPLPPEFQLKKSRKA